MQKVCRVIVIVIKENQDWHSYVKDKLEPIMQLEKGKLCQDHEGEQDQSSDGNIFDDDFINDAVPLT